MMWTWLFMITNEIRWEIQKRLDQIEKDQNVRILYACESGSRAWGFPSPNSDYDVRFIYINSRDYYLSPFKSKKRDVIDTVEYPIVDNIDIGGWEITKALDLIYKSNAVVAEWMCSPICYKTDPKAFNGLVKIIGECQKPVALWYHYYSLALSGLNDLFTNISISIKHMEPKRNVLLKKYFYTLRAVFAMMYIDQYKTRPPMNFTDLLAFTKSGNIYIELDKLLTLKRTTDELGTGPYITNVSSFIKEKMIEFSERRKQIEEDLKVSTLQYHEIEDPFNNFFQSLLF